MLPARRRPHPLAAVTALCFASATLANFLSTDWRGHALGYGIASLLLASPFAVLLAGHLTLARTWRRNAFFAAGNLLFGIAWFMASFVMRWFQPGWMGAVFLGLSLSIVAVGYLLLSREIPEAVPPPGKPTERHA